MFFRNDLVHLSSNFVPSFLPRCVLGTLDILPRCPACPRFNSALEKITQSFIMFDHIIFQVNKQEKLPNMHANNNDRATEINQQGRGRSSNRDNVVSRR